jgi:tricorn protease
MNMVRLSTFSSPSSAIPALAAARRRVGLVSLCSRVKAGLLSGGLGAVFLLAAPCTTWPQLLVTPPKPIVGARMPALSPDGKQLAFVYQGDIWLVGTGGGRATPLTWHVEMDAFPVFSPDGQWIAFGSKRNGNWDIYLVSAAGGSVQQLTFHAADEIPQSWSPDGSKILFSAKLDSPHAAVYALDPKTLRLSKLLEDYASLNWPDYSPDGKKVVFGRNGFHWTRPRYVGSAAAQVWLFDLQEGRRQSVTSDERQHLWTRFLPGGTNLVTVTTGESTPSVSKLGQPIPRVIDNPQRTPNLWVLDLADDRTQRTFFTGGAVRCPSVAKTSGDIAFEYEQDLWVLWAHQCTPSKLEIFAAHDAKQNTARREKLTYGTGEAEPSPSGKTFAFGLRGDIWTVPIERKGPSSRSAEFARRLTEWEGDDSDFVWSLDEKKLYFTSDRSLNTRLYELDLESLESRCLWNRTEDVCHPILSPDGRELSFWVAGAEGGLFVLTLATGETRRVAKAPGTHWYGLGGGDIKWSPDSKWLAYNCRGENQAWNIWITSADDPKPVNVTSLNADHRHFAWSPDGKYLFFHSNRDGIGLYVLPLEKEPARVTDSEMRYTKVKGDLTVRIDFDGITRRIRKIGSQTPQADLTVSTEGTILFLADGDVWSVSYDGKETKRLTSEGGKRSLRICRDGQTSFFIRGGELWTMKLSDRAQEKVTFTADWDQNVRAERVAAFTQFWRSYYRGFYDPNFHGRDWSQVRRRYEPMLEAVETREEFATLLQMMVGELDASHSEVTPASGGPTSPVTPHLGFTLDYGYPGPGLRVAEVPPGVPGSYPQTAIKAGEYVLAVNGREVNLDEHLYRWINDKQDREFEFLVSSKPEKTAARTVRYRIMTQEEWKDLAYRNRIERLREYVEKQSEGKVGYLHLPGMGQQNQTQFEREAYEYGLSKDAMIIDVRFNSGGYIADTLIDWLERKPRGFIQPRDGAVQASPVRAWNKPITVLVNEHSFSNGEIFAYAVRARGLGQLVGTATPGYVIWTDGLALVDGTGARMPMSASYRLDGTPQENCGERPDFTVPLTPEDWLAQRDPQVDQAIALLRSAPSSPSPAAEHPSVVAR